MTKLRVYELGKELGMESKDVIRRLGKMGAEVKNHMSAVDDKYADMLRDIMRPKIALKEARAAEKERAESHSETKASPVHESDGKKETPVKPVKAAGKQEVKAEPQKDIKDKSVPKSKEEDKKIEAEKTPKSVTSENKTEIKRDETGTAPAPKATSPKLDENKVSEEKHKPAAERQEVKPAREVPRQQGIFAKDTNQPRQQGVFAKSNQPRQQGVFAKDNRRGPNNRQNRDNHQNRQGQGERGSFSGHQNDRNYQNRQGQGGYQNRHSQNERGGYQGHQNDRNYQNQNRSSQGGYQNRNSQNERNFQPRQNQGDRQSYQNNRASQSGYQKDKTAASEVMRPQEKRDPRRFEQKKKNNQYESRKKDLERNNFEHKRHNVNQKQKKQKKKEEMPPVVPKTVVIGETVVISELAKSMSKTAAELIKTLFNLGVMATVNQEIDSDTAIILGDEYGITVEVKVDKTMEIMEEDTDDESTLVPRPPVVTVMGHVDHGKTSLLDAIRNTNVISREAGGITQHIGAYQVEISGKKITFLDTPGHEAFTSMRARGAQVTDIAVLVVAADDGVMPQTVEAINHAKAANVPIIVAINKIDKPGANIDKIRQELTEYELVDEEWGGNTIMVPVSAKKEQGIENLLEMILLVAEVAELKSNPNRNARGTVIESQLDKGRGAVATVLVQKGTLHVGDILVAGTEFAKVRAMIDDKRRRTKAAGPSTPVEILGFSDVPLAGEIFVCVNDEKDARHIADHNAQVKREHEMNKSAKVSLDDFFKQISAGEVKDLNIVLKADVHGSVEALSQSIKNLSTDEVRVNIIHSGVGAIVETDVMLAEASGAIIIGFNVRPDVNTKKAAEKAGVDIRMYRVIYEALDDIKAAMTGLLDPEFKEVIVGHVEVRDVIKVPKVGLIAGSYVLDGKVVRNGKVRLLRNGIVVHEGDIASLRRFKDDVKEVQTGYECGICIDNFNDIKVDDQMEIYIMEETKRELE